MSRNKSVKEKKIEESLGITSDDDDFDMSEEIDNEDNEEKALIEKRREIAKNALSSYIRNNGEKDYDSDEEFTRDMLRDLAVTGMTLLKLQEEEMQIDPSARNAETAAAIISSVTATVDKLNSVGLNKKKLELEEKKVNMKEGSNNVTNNFIGVSSFSELVKNIKDAGEDLGIVNTPKEVEAEIVEDDDDRNDE